MSNVTAVHLYVTDLDRAVDFYSRLLGYGPQAAYDEGENAHSAFFVLEQRTYLVLDLGPGSRPRSRWEHAPGARRRRPGAGGRASTKRGVDGGAIVRTRFGTDVYDLADPDGHLIRIGPAWTLHAIEGAV